MAARNNLTHDEKTRERIKTSQLINRLQSFAFGEVELSKTQVSAIAVLLKKTLPDLASMQVEHSGSVGISVEIVRLSDG